jgi:hypothetical protein
MFDIGLQGGAPFSPMKSIGKILMDDFNGLFFFIVFSGVRLHYINFRNGPGQKPLTIVQ